MSWDAQIELLKVQYKALKPREREVRDEEAAEGRRRADIRIRELRQALADDFRRYREAGMPQYAIQEVLGTKDWNTLRQWRELMNVQSPREIRAAIAAENSHFRWSDDYATVTVVKNSKGDELETPIIYQADTIWIKSDLFYARSTSERDELSAMRADSYKGWMKQLHDELEAQIEAGNITAPNEGE